MKYDYKEGDRVYHRTMGYGTVIHVDHHHIPETLYTPSVVETRVVTRLEQCPRNSVKPLEIETRVHDEAVSLMLLPDREAL